MAENKQIDPNKVRVGDVILVASGTKSTMDVQRKLGYGDSCRWTHVAGSIGGYDLVEGQIPKSRVCNLQKDYVDKGIEIRIMRNFDPVERDKKIVTELNDKNWIVVRVWEHEIKNDPAKVIEKIIDLPWISASARCNQEPGGGAGK